MKPFIAKSQCLSNKMIIHFKSSKREAHHYENDPQIFQKRQCRESPQINTLIIPDFDKVLSVETKSKTKLQPMMLNSEKNDNRPNQGAHNKNQLTKRREISTSPNRQIENKQVFANYSS